MNLASQNHNYLVRESIGRTADTHYYFAPEHLDSIQHDQISEIFLMGALFFRLIGETGLLTGYNAHEALHKVRSSGPRRLAEVNPAVSRELTEFCLRLCAVDRQDRPQSFRALQGEIDRFGRTRPVEMTQSIVRRRSQDLSERNQTLPDPSGTQRSIDDGSAECCSSPQR